MKIDLETPVKVIVRPALPEVSKMLNNVEIVNFQVDILKKIVKVNFRNIAKPFIIFEGDNYPSDNNLTPEVIAERVKELLEGQTI